MATKVPVKKDILDANVFISAHRGYYDFDLAPSFWKSLVGHAGKTIFVV